MRKQAFARPAIVETVCNITREFKIRDQKTVFLKSVLVTSVSLITSTWATKHVFDLPFHNVTGHANLMHQKQMV
jgi:hypothetical protein